MKTSAEQSWKPRRFVPVDRELYMQLSTRGGFDPYIRAYTACHGTQNVINIQQTYLRVVNKF